jgi:hypothetical protein
MWSKWKTKASLKRRHQATFRYDLSLIASSKASFTTSLNIRRQRVVNDVVTIRQRRRLSTTFMEIIRIFKLSERIEFLEGEAKLNDRVSLAAQSTSKPTRNF